MMCYIYEPSNRWGDMGFYDRNVRQKNVEKLMLGGFKMCLSSGRLSRCVWVLFLTYYWPTLKTKYREQPLTQTGELNTPSTLELNRNHRSHTYNKPFNKARATKVDTRHLSHTYSLWNSLSWITSNVLSSDSANKRCHNKFNLNSIPINNNLSVFLLHFTACSIFNANTFIHFFKCYLWVPEPFETAITLFTNLERCCPTVVRDQI